MAATRAPATSLLNVLPPSMLNWRSAEREPSVPKQRSRRHKSREILVRVRLPETWVLGAVFRLIDSPPVLEKAYERLSGLLRLLLKYPVARVLHDHNGYILSDEFHLGPEGFSQRLIASNGQNWHGQLGL